jgi:hypothetical protein
MPGTASTSRKQEVSASTIVCCFVAKKGVSLRLHLGAALGTLPAVGGPSGSDDTQSSAATATHHHPRINHLPSGRFLGPLDSACRSSLAHLPRLSIHPELAGLLGASVRVAIGHGAIQEPHSRHKDPLATASEICQKKSVDLDFHVSGSGVFRESYLNCSQIYLLANHEGPTTLMVSGASKGKQAAKVAWAAPHSTNDIHALRS